jgi:hypothetical protein
LVSIVVARPWSQSSSDEPVSAAVEVSAVPAYTDQEVQPLDDSAHDDSVEEQDEPTGERKLAAELGAAAPLTGSPGAAVGRKSPPAQRPDWTPRRDLKPASPATPTNQQADDPTDRESEAAPPAPAERWARGLELFSDTR